MKDYNLAEPMEVYNFKAPAELNEALFNIIKQLNKPDKRVTKSSFICDHVMSHPLVVAELERIKEKKRKTTVTD